MRMMKGSRALWALGATAVGVMVLVGSASADYLSDPNAISTERSGSVIVFPKVVWDGTRDTVIQIANTTNAPVAAHCFYINNAPEDPSRPPSLLNPPQCSETDFDILLTRQQPTNWVASLGRQVMAGVLFRVDTEALAQVTTDGLDHYGSGIDPGLVPPVPLGFIGELKCIQVNPDDGLPWRGNALKGEATLRRLDGDVAKYNALALHGNTDMGVQEGDVDDLFLDLTTANPNYPPHCPPDAVQNAGEFCGADADCGGSPCQPQGTAGNNGEYSACPDTLILDFTAVGAQDLVLAGPTGIGTCGGAGGCPVTSDLTLVPCQENLETQQPGTVTVQFLIFNEFEQHFSTSVTVTCFAEIALDSIGGGIATNNPFSIVVLGTFSAHARINPNPGEGGVLGLLEEARHLDQTSPPAGLAGAVVASNLHIEGNRFDAATDAKGNPKLGATDHIVIPAP